MNRSLSTKSAIAFFVMDLAFGPVASYAYFKLLAIEASGATLAIMCGLFLVKMLVGGAILLRTLKPAEDLLRAAPSARTDAKLRAADHALQVAPFRFATLYSLLWFSTYGLVTLWFQALPADQIPVSPRAFDAAILVWVAMIGGTFAFALPLMSVLTADAAGVCSTLARERKLTLDRSPTSLPARVAIVSVCIGIGPTLWMAALGFMKQVDTDREGIAMQAVLGATSLAQQATSERLARGELPADALERLVSAGSQAPLTVALVVDNQGRALSGRASEQELASEPGLAAWLAANVVKERSSSLIRAREERVVAFHRIDDDRVAAVIRRDRPSASTAFLVSSGAFAILVGIWAPLTAWLLARAVSSPIERLTNAARQVVEEGNLAKIGALPVIQNDEVGLLTEQFNDVLDLMRSLGASANAIAAGNLQVDVAGNGDLPEAFRGMLVSLDKIVREIRETAVDLASAAAEIFAASQEQEAAATSQSSAMVEISRTMDSLSESAAHVSEAVQGVLSNAERALKNTDDMVVRIGELSAHAGRIGEILEVIRDIADRSDLLALNGSLEASRAGDGGRGFALVAGEMRRLAERVTASVQDVKRLVSDIRDSGSSTVMATEESKKLAEGTTEAARQITFVTQQQRSGTEQVSHSVKDIAEVITQAASATSQTRASAQGLKVQADRLSELVRRFQVAREGTDAA